MDSIFKTIFLVGFVAGCVIRAVCVFRARRATRQKQDAVADDHGLTGLEKLLMFLVFIGMQVLPILYLLTSWLDFIDYRLPVWAGLSAGWIGTAVFVLALWLLWRSHLDLGSSFSPKLQVTEQHTLVTNGVYRTIRHPMYAAHWLWAVAQALLLQNWIAGLAMLASFLPLYRLRVGLEEQMMLDHFGQQYREYMAQTGRVVPRRSR